MPLGVHHYTSVSTSRDGQRIVATVANPSASLWSVPIRDRSSRKTTPGRTRCRRPQARPGSSLRRQDALFYLSGSGTRDGLWQAQGGQASDVWRGVDGAVSEPRRGLTGRQPRRRRRRREGKRHLSIMYADGTGAKTLAGSIEIDGAAGQGAADWAPDGTRIVTAGRDEKGPALFVIAADTGAATRLLDGTWVNPDLVAEGRSDRLRRSTVHRPGHGPWREEDGTVVELPFMTRPGGYRFLPTDRAWCTCHAFRVWISGSSSSPAGSRINSPSSTITGALRTFDITQRWEVDRLRSLTAELERRPALSCRSRAMRSSTRSD